MNDSDYLRRRDVLRSVLGIAAATTAAALVSGCEGSDAGLLQPDGGVSTGKDASAKDATKTIASDKSDAAILNDMLAFEYGAVDAYGAGAGILGAPSSDDPLIALAPVLLATALTFHDQHVAHAEALRAAITGLGGAPLATSAVQFVAPSGFTPSITNVLKLACNAERAGALSIQSAIGELAQASNRFLAASMEANLTQHFMVLFAVLQGLVDPGPALTTLTAGQLVPDDFSADLGTGTSLEDLEDFDVTM